MEFADRVQPCAELLRTQIDKHSCGSAFLYPSANSERKKYAAIKRKIQLSKGIYRGHRPDCSCADIPDKYAMERGGWSSDHVMKSVYQHTFTKEREAVDDKIDDFFNSIIETL